MGTERRMMVASSWGKGDGELVLNGYRGLVCEGESFEKQMVVMVAQKCT